MSENPRYLQGYAVIRVDDGPLDDIGSVRESTIDDAEGPAPGPARISVKEVVMTVEEARREVVRLNALNAGKACTYYWQTTHIFLDGGSHGSVGCEGHDSEITA
jgi:hypothetical protein